MIAEGTMRFMGFGIASGLMMLQASAALGGSAVPEPSQDSAVEIAQSADACGVIDDAMAAQALDARVKRDPPSGLPSLCAWRSLETPGDALTVQMDDGGEAKYDFDHAKLRVRDLPDVGDKAFAVVSPAGFVQIGMMRADRYVTIVLMRQNGSDRLERVTALAKAIAKRM